MLNDINFINIAHQVAKASNCISKNVGAVIVRDGRILSTGYNGTPSGFINCDEKWNNKYTKEHHQWSKTYEIHAEMNAILWAARNGISIKEATIYSSLEPCSECSKNIIGSGILRIVYDIPYERNHSQIIQDFIRKNGVIIEQIKR